MEEKQNNTQALKRLFRLKQITNFQEEDEDSKNLKKVLGTGDLISLGVGSCVGTGMYLVTGIVAKTMAGPAVIISYLVAGLAAMLSGLCYAELGVRVPHTTGSAYIYSYVTVGEIIAFIIGWNMILEYIIGTAACASALSTCVDILSTGAISNVTSTWGDVWDSPPDILAWFITLVMMFVFVNGVKSSIQLNNFLSIINFLSWVIVVFVGLFFIHLSNWSPFAPFGIRGILKGAATCFYAFIGFDVIATTGEEAKDPKRSIPKAIITSLIILMVAYVSCTIILTLMVPYVELNEEAALVRVWAQIGYPFLQWVICIGAVSALTASMFGSMFPMPRIAYAMAKDGLIFRFLSEVNDKGVPACATLCLGLIASVCALILPFEVLVEMMSIGTLLAYTLVDGCVLILRYQTDQQKNYPSFISDTEGVDCGEEEETCPSIWGILYNYIFFHQLPVDEQTPVSQLSGKIVLKLCFLALILIVIVELLIMDLDLLIPTVPLNIFICFVVGFLLLLIGLVLHVISKFPQDKQSGFVTPGVPWIPTLGIIVNIFLILRLSPLTLVRFIVWMFIGMVIYFKYGINESSEAVVNY
ncbi:solute carrier family 7 member 14 [Lepeophtheirus salmonis]|uniref:solute carrier family 7 member 14 n=1 Tax=Lepeophtheirus salmonis TaxID=72036 RepID=UPI001AE1D244|nr:probable cationic amino acid transporter [Lepeophtheirus salmonis]